MYNRLERALQQLNPLEYAAVLLIVGLLAASAGSGVSSEATIKTPTPTPTPPIILTMNDNCYNVTSWQVVENQRIPQNLSLTPCPTSTPLAQ